MGKVQQLRDKLAAVTIADQERAILKIIDDNKSIVLDLETNRLLGGKGSDGAPITPFYRSARYADFKLTLNPAGVVDLKVTGAFHNSFFIDDSKFPITFGASDEKTDELVAKYGDVVFGLDAQGKQDLRDQVKQQIQEYYHQLVHV